MTQPPEVVIVVLNYNGLEDTRRCLESLGRVSYPRCTVVVVDNGSAEDPEPAVRAIMPAAVVLKNGGNLGYAGGNNRGLALALARGAEFILVLNNDTIVAPDIIECLLSAFAADPGLAVAGPVVNHLDEPAAVMTEGVRFNRGPGPTFFTPVAAGAGLDEAPSLVPVDIVNGCCMMLRASALGRIGVFDEALFIVHEESDLCLRALERGFRCAVVGRTLVWHKGSSSFTRTGRQLQRYFDTRNLLYLLRRHRRLVGTRSLLPSMWQYLRYAYYRYCHELEAGSRAAADAVVEGLVDALANVTGPYDPGRRRRSGPVRALFHLGRGISRVRRRGRLRAANGAV